MRSWPKRVDSCWWEPEMVEGRMVGAKGTSEGPGGVEGMLSDISAAARLDKIHL